MNNFNLTTMFTGLIQGTGTIAAKQEHGDDCTLTIATAAFACEQLEMGESICTNGTCITVIAKDASSFSADLSAETCSTTTLGKVNIGDSVNLEQSLTLATKLGGHLVSGHVDGVGQVTAIQADGTATNYTFSAPSAIAKYIATKGSIVIDGASLTVNWVDNNNFGVTIIPHTQELTVIKGYKLGTQVNLEVDLIARYVERLLQFK
jgi:riboflavin synthase